MPAGVGQFQRKHERGCRQQHRSHLVRSFWRLRLSWKPFREQVVANSTPVVKRSGQRVWTKRWRALRHFASDRVADEKLMERGSLNLWDNGNLSKDRALRKKVDDLGKNVDDHGASFLGGPSVPGMLAGVVGRVVPRPAVESDCESGSLDTRTGQTPVKRELGTAVAQYSYCSCWKRR